MIKVNEIEVIKKWEASPVNPTRELWRFGKWHFVAKIFSDGICQVMWADKNGVEESEPIFGHNTEDRRGAMIRLAECWPDLWIEDQMAEGKEVPTAVRFLLHSAWRDPIAFPTARQARKFARAEGWSKDIVPIVTDDICFICGSPVKIETWAKNTGCLKTCRECSASLTGGSY